MVVTDCYDIENRRNLPFLYSKTLLGLQMPIEALRTDEIKFKKMHA